MTGSNSALQILAEHRALAGRAGYDGLATRRLDELMHQPQADAEATLLKESKAAFDKIKQTGAFSPDQLNYLQTVYDKVLDGGLKNLDDLTMILTDQQTRMSDDERLTAIDRIYASMQQHVVMLRDFNRQNSVAAYQRAKENTDLQSINNLYNK